MNFGYNVMDNIIEGVIENVVCLVQLVCAIVGDRMCTEFESLESLTTFAIVPEG